MDASASVFAREMIQARLLGALFSDRLRKGIALKGGFAMRAAAKSQRHTKDIDLAAGLSLHPSEVRARIRRAIAELQASGLSEGMTVTEPKQTDTTMRWKISGAVGGTEYHLTVEVSRRSELDYDHIRQAEYASPGCGRFVVDSFDPEALAVSKLDCLSNPNREAPRDVYDLFILVTMDVRPPQEMVARLGPERIDQIRRNVWAKVEKMDYDRFRTELLPYLPGDAGGLIDEGTWDAMRLTVATEVEKWIDGHTPPADGGPVARVA